MKKREWIVLAATVLIVAALLMPKESAAEYNTVPIQRRTVEETIEVSGVIVPKSSFLASPLSTGKLRLLVQKGETVRAGQALFEIEGVPEDTLTKLQELLEERKAETLSLSELYKTNTVYSPMDGVVQSLHASNGQTVMLGSPVLSLNSDAQVLQFNISQSNRENLREGQTVRAARKGREYTGSIQEISLSDNGQYTVTALLDNASALDNGMQMDVSVVLRRVTAPCVPLEAIQNGDFLYCVTDAGISQIPIRTSICDEMYMSLTMGPPEGTRVLLGDTP